MLPPNMNPMQSGQNPAVQFLQQILAQRKQQGNMQMPDVGMPAIQPTQPAQNTNMNPLDSNNGKSALAAILSLFGGA